MPSVAPGFSTIASLLALLPGKPLLGRGGLEQQRQVGWRAGRLAGYAKSNDRPIQVACDLRRATGHLSCFLLK